METDSSFVLYEKYYSLSNHTIEIELLNNVILKGKFIGFIKGSRTYISKWEFATKNELLGSDSFGTTEAQIIDHKEIKKYISLKTNPCLLFKHNQMKKQLLSLVVLQCF